MVVVGAAVVVAAVVVAGTGFSQMARTSSVQLMSCQNPLVLSVFMELYNLCSKTFIVWCLPSMSTHIDAQDSSVLPEFG